jgi:hypothetical protein
MSFSFQMEIVDLEVPLLMGLDVILRSGVTVALSLRKLHTCTWQTPIEVRNGHTFVPPEHGIILFSKQELTALHKKLSHPSAAKMNGFLQRARPQASGSNTSKAIIEVS